MPNLVGTIGDYIQLCGFYLSKLCQTHAIIIASKIIRFLGYIYSEKRDESFELFRKFNF